MHRVGKKRLFRESFLADREAVLINCEPFLMRRELIFGNWETVFEHSQDARRKRLANRLRGTRSEKAAHYQRKQLIIEEIGLPPGVRKGSAFPVRPPKLLEAEPPDTFISRHGEASLTAHRRA